MKKQVKNSVVVFSFLMCMCLSVQSQEQKIHVPELNMDLPDETEETDLIEKGEVQVECAYLHATFNKGVQPSVMQGLLKYGLHSRFELRLFFEEGYGRDRYLEETVEATSPLALSFKWSLLKEHNVLPDVTLVGYLKLPITSHTREQNAYWSPIVSLAFQNKGGERWKLEYNPGLQQDPFGTSWTSFFNASLHYKVNDGLEIFSEYFGQYTASDPSCHNAGAGFSYQFNASWEAFAVAGTTINYSSTNRFFSTGLAFRI